MKKWLLLFFLLQVAHCSCPSDFELVKNGECRGKYTSVSGPHDDLAKTVVANCDKIKGVPIIIHDEEDQTYWTKKATAWTVIGLMCNSTSKKWMWADGSALDFKPSKYEQSLDEDCNQSWNTWYLGTDGYWSGEHCNGCQMTTNVFCIVQLHPPVASGDGCDSFGDDSEDGVCYQVAAPAEDWQDAQLICAKVGANLASIHNGQENSFIRRLAVSKGAVNGIFLGATLSGKGADFGWIDGSDWDYTNFHSGFPIPGVGDCLAMDTATSSGLWMNNDCAEKLPAACSRDQKPIVEPTCGDGPWHEGILITTPGFPYNSSIPCEFFLNVNPGKKVEVEIVFLEANKCCDSLVIYDGYLGGHVKATLTGETRNVSYTSTSNAMKVSWQPDGGVNVRGMAMMYYEV